MRTRSRKKKQQAEPARPTRQQRRFMEHIRKLKCLEERNNNQVWNFNNKNGISWIKFCDFPRMCIDKTQSSFSTFPIPFFSRFQVFLTMELFILHCNNRQIPSKISLEWLESMKQQYSSDNRHFHNVALIEKKLTLAKEIAGDDGFNDALVFAILFQYFNYDVKRDLKKENCDEFRLFVEQAGIKDVSCT